MKNLLLMVGFFAIGCSLTAQTYADKETVQDQVLQGENLSAQVLSSLGIGTSTDPGNSQIEGNRVFVVQIGEMNRASIKTATQASEINLRQRGVGNISDLTYQVRTVVSNLEQNGDFNYIRDFVIDNTADISIDLKQDGDFLNFQREGVNSLTKSLQFTQTSASPSLIVRSLN